MNNGSLGEVAAAKYFIEKGYDVFLPFDGHAPFDLVIYKHRHCYRVSVKSTARKRQGKYVVELRQNRYKKKEPFNALDSDFLFVYIIPAQQGFVLESWRYDGKSTITLD